MTLKNEQKESQQVALYNSLRVKLQALYRRDQYEIHDKVIEFHDYLKKKYPNAREHRLFHLISGSTLLDSYDDMDFDGIDSVENFINTECAKAFPSGLPEGGNPGESAAIS
jgi:hypothetical protein